MTSTMKFYGDSVSCFFLVQALQLSKFYENEVKHDKNTFKKGLSMAFEVKNA